MGRQDQMKALYEFFGGTQGTYHTTPSSVFPDIKTVVQGEPINKMQVQMPLLYVLAPRSREHRASASSSFKFIDYDLRAVLVWLTPGVEQGSGDRGSSILDQFYGLLDEIADRIRTNKILKTSSYPTGASVRFGESFSIEEDHEIRNNMLLCVANITISSTEQVFS